MLFHVLVNSNSGTQWSFKHRIANRALDRDASLNWLNEWWQCSRLIPQRQKVIDQIFFDVVKSIVCESAAIHLKYHFRINCLPQRHFRMLASMFVVIFVIVKDAIIFVTIQKSWVFSFDMNFREWTHLNRNRTNHFFQFSDSIRWQSCFRNDLKYLLKAREQYRHIHFRLTSWRNKLWTISQRCDIFRFVQV